MVLLLFIHKTRSVQTVLTAIIFKACWKIGKGDEESQAILGNSMKYLRMRGFNSTMLLIYQKKKKKRLRGYFITLHNFPRQEQNNKY